MVSNKLAAKNLISFCLCQLAYTFIFSLPVLAVPVDLLGRALRITKRRKQETSTIAEVAALLCASHAPEIEYQFRRLV